MRNTRGFTLTEMLVGIAISSVLVTGIFRFYSGIQKISYTQVSDTEMQSEIKFGLEQMTRYIFSAGYKLDRRDAFENSSDSVLSVAMLSENSATCADGDTLRYNFSLDTNGILVYSVHCNGTLKSTGRLIPQADSLRFSFYNAAGDSVTDLTEASTVEISLRCFRDISGSSQKHRRIINTRVTPRNLII